MNNIHTTASPCTSRPECMLKGRAEFVFEYNFTLTCFSYETQLGYERTERVFRKESIQHSHFSSIELLSSKMSTLRDVYIIGSPAALTTYSARTDFR